MGSRIVAFPKHKTKAFLDGTRELAEMLMTTEVIEAEVTDVTPRAMIVAPTTLFQTSDPAQVIEEATKTATALANVIRAQGLASPIADKEYVRCEGWTLLGSMLGVFPVETWTRPLDGPAKGGQKFGYEARVEARRGDLVIGAAEAMCTRDERRWATADDYAIRSMAQTRATAKALRMPLGFVMQLAGYGVTPYEEMTGVQQPKARAPHCKMHDKDMRFIKAGTSKAGKPYDAFWGCPNKECKTTVKDVDWQAHLTRLDAEKEPAPEYDPHDVPIDDATMEPRSESETPPVVIGDSNMGQKRTIRGLFGKIDALPARQRETFYAGLLVKYPKCQGTDGKIHLTPLDKAEADDIIATAGAYLREDA